MSLFASLLGDFNDDDFLNNQINSMNMQMRNMNRLMNSMMPDPFNMLAPYENGFNAANSLMDRNSLMGGGLFGFPNMRNMNRLLNADIGNNGASYCSSSVISMSSGPDGRPQYYQATSSSKTGPGGIRETRKTVQDSLSGVKKMAIGHHIGERSHIIEKEQNYHSGEQEERQEFINLDEEEAETFDREFSNKARMGTSNLEITEAGYHHSPHHRNRSLPAITSSAYANSGSSSPPPTSSVSAENSTKDISPSPTYQPSTTSTKRAHSRNATLATPRRPLRTLCSSPLALTTGHTSSATTISVHPHPYHNVPRRNMRSKHSKNHHQQPQQLPTQQQNEEPEPRLPPKEPTE